MNNNAQSLRSFISRLTPLSWTLVALSLAIVVFAVVVQLPDNKNGQTAAIQPRVDASTGLIENTNELSPVAEGEDTSGEILPPNTKPPEASSSQSDVFSPAL
jgi:hypothetical protein